MSKKTAQPSAQITCNDRIRNFILWTHRVRTFLFYKPFLKKAGSRFTLVRPIRFVGPQHITVGSDVSIHDFGWLLTLQIDSDKPDLLIEDGASIGHFSHITCVKKVHIGKNVLAADRVYISDNLHGYEDIHTPIARQKVIFKGEVSIGENTWIGENVSIIGCKIGRHCVIGANSVVTRDIPDYSVAAGAPARVIKKYNAANGLWEKAGSV